MPSRATPIRFALLLLLCAGLPGIVEGGKVKDALFRSWFGKKERESKPESKIDEDQAELLEWLKASGFEEYATHEWIEKFDEDLAYDSIEDLTHLVADEEYEELNIPKETAMKMQDAARKHLMRLFLKAVPLPEGAAPDVFEKLLEPLLAAGYDEPEEVADIEEDEAEGLGIEKAHHKAFVGFADEYEARELLQLILETHEPTVTGETNPFASEAVWKPMVEAMVKFGVRNLSDVSNLSPMDGLSAEHLAVLKADPRVAAHATKQEL